MHDDLEAIVAALGDLGGRLLVLDFDGTLSQIVEHPADAVLAEGARDALDGLLASHPLAIMSGRSLSDLAPRIDDDRLLLVGGHGSEALLPGGERVRLVDTAGLATVIERARHDVDRVVGAHDDWFVEVKPHSLAVHFRRVDRHEVELRLGDVEQALLRYVDEDPGWNLLHGHEVLELRPEGVTKAAALAWLAGHHAGRVPVVIGDDVTDEEAFRAARARGGAGIVVVQRPRPTAARWRLDSPARVIELLVRLAQPAPEARARVVTDGADDEPAHAIASYGLISDNRSAALVSPDGSVDWFCVPRFDSPSVFAALLDGRRGGRFRVRPRDHARLSVQRTYLGDSNVLVTRFVRSGDPVLTLTDLLVYSRVNAFDPAYAGHQLVRRIEAFGRVEVDIEFHPRFDYGRAHTTITADGGHLRAVSGAEHMELDGEGVEWSIADHDDGNGNVATALVSLEPGDEIWLSLRTAGADRSPHSHLSPPDLLDLTLRTWGRWAEHIKYEGPWREQVVRSALVLKSLVFEPSGAFVAAPTTSLPESIGGERNWDYRYAWIRDSAYVLECFLRIGHSREAETFIRWLSEVSDRVGGAEELRPLYRVTGDSDLTEVELDHLAGYRGSRPVRIGNGAAAQLQMDIYGAAMQLGYLTTQLGGEIPSARWPVIVQLVATVAERWAEPDSGLWEIRSEPRHHTFSKFQCWLAIDRAIKIGRDLGLRAPYGEWRLLAAQIADSIFTEGWNEEVGAFTQAYGSTALDASVLLLPLRGLIPPHDQRVRRTVEAIRRDLETSDGLLLRYRSEDGLEGHEGAFVMCSFWLIELLARMGELDEAERLMHRLCSLSGPLGLFAEEIDPLNHEHLGNYPQGFTHMGLIAAATAITEERARART